MQENSAPENGENSSGIPPTEDENSEPVVEIIDEPPTLYSQVIEILSHHSLCIECLGRQYSYLGTGTDNSQRGASLLLGLTMECHHLLLKNTVTKQFTLYGQKVGDILTTLVTKTNYPPPKILVQQLLDKKVKGITIQPEISLKEGSLQNFKCHLCENSLLPEYLEHVVGEITGETQEYEFKSFRIGTRLSPRLAEREDEFRARFAIRTGEAFKVNLNRLLGKMLQIRWTIPVDISDPELTILVNFQPEKISLEFQSKPVFIRGRYLKFVRNLPQTQWHCYSCRGKKVTREGKVCPDCKGSGRVYEHSIQDYFTKYLLRYSGGASILFHGAGREDLDVRCLGIGRTFVIEARMPKFRAINLENLASDINLEYGNQIHISDLKFSSKSEVIQLKNDSQYLRKNYTALVYLNEPIGEAFFEDRLIKLQSAFLEKPVDQRTPVRVVHRRSDKTRLKKIFAVSGKYIDSVHFLLKLDTQGGTYIKELISGDKGRTNPSVASIYGIQLHCVELDVIHKPPVE